MYKNGDGKVKADAAKFKKYSDFTAELVEQAGGLSGTKKA
jgi:hypothetical protein